MVDGEKVWWEKLHHHCLSNTGDLAMCVRMDLNGVSRALLGT